MAVDTAPKPMGTAEFAMRIVARNTPGAWFCLLSTEDTTKLAASRLRDELSVLSDLPVICLEPRDSEELANQVRGAGAGTIILSGVDAFPEVEWARVDRLRSWLERDLAVVLVLSRRAFERISRAAPNFSSWLGGAAWTWDRDAEVLSPEEREARLVALREWAKMTDEEMLSQAEQDSLPSEPEYAEWLVLLNRGDLLEY